MIRLFLVKNGHYRERWNLGSITRIVYRNVKEPSTAMQLLLRGEIDVLEQLTQPDFIDVMARVSTIDVRVVYSSVGSNTMQLWANIKKPPFDNVMVRQAIAAAIDFHSSNSLSGLQSRLHKSAIRRTDRPRPDHHEPIGSCNDLSRGPATAGSGRRHLCAGPRSECLRPSGSYPKPQMEP